MGSFKEKQKAKARSTVERMTSALDGTCMTIHWQAWCQDLEDTKRAKRFQEELDGATGAFKSYQAKKKEEARKVLSRMLAGQTFSLLTVVLQSWNTITQEEKEA